jgi:hypothetical protein
VAAFLLLTMAEGCVYDLETHRVLTGPPGRPYAGSVAIHMDGAPLPTKYEEVALVQAEGYGQNMSTLLPALSAQAAALGCDAVILVRVDQGAGHASATGVAVRIETSSALAHDPPLPLKSK